MAHFQQRRFCQKVKSIFPDSFDNVNVLDVGSLDINGSNRDLFSGDKLSYTGLDIAPGKNVTVVSKGHEWNAPDDQYDTVISTECFEHDMFYELTLKNIIRMLKPGGLFIFTCATTGRPEHGTLRTSKFDSPLTTKIQDGGWCDYYKNLTELDIRKAISIDATFSRFEFEIDNFSHDLYFWGFKK